MDRGHRGMGRGRGHFQNYGGANWRGQGQGEGEEDKDWRGRGGDGDKGFRGRPHSSSSWGSRGHQGRGQQNHYEEGRGRGRGVVAYQSQDHDTRGQRVEETEPKLASKIIGVCDGMCPRSEIILREREGLLHKFEILQNPDPLLSDPSNSSSWPVQGPSNIGGEGTKRFSAGRKPLPKADYKKTIKSFARSAAGQDKTHPEDLRPVQVLKETVTYLCEEILPRTDSPFPVIYDFIFDRLRGVRQDLVIQRIEDKDAIRILETIVKFHIYSEFRLREEPISVYDPHINQKHLVDCLRKLLSLYEFNDYVETSRADFEGLNCLVYINSYHVITRAFSIKKQIHSPILNYAIEMALSYQCRNYVRFFRRMGQLPVLLQMYCLHHVQDIRQSAFRIMCMAYGVNSCKIPLSWITTQLLYTSISELHRDLGHLTIEILREEDKPEKFVKFQKSQVNVIQAKADGIKSEIQSPCIQSIVKHATNGTIAKLCLSF